MSIEITDAACLPDGRVVISTSDALLVYDRLGTLLRRISAAPSSIVLLPQQDEVLLVGNGLYRVHLLSERSTRWGSAWLSQWASSSYGDEWFVVKRLGEDENVVGVIDLNQQSPVIRVSSLTETEDTPEKVMVVNDELWVYWSYWGPQLIRYDLASLAELSRVYGYSPDILCDSGWSERHDVRESVGVSTEPIFLVSDGRQVWLTGQDLSWRATITPTPGFPEQDAAGVVPRVFRLVRLGSVSLAVQGDFVVLGWEHCGYLSASLFSISARRFVGTHTFVRRFPQESSSPLMTTEVHTRIEGSSALCWTRDEVVIFSLEREPATVVIRPGFEAQSYERMQSVYRNGWEG